MISVIPIAMKTKITGGYRTTEDSNWRKRGLCPVLFGLPMRMRPRPRKTKTAPMTRWIIVVLQERYGLGCLHYRINFAQTSIGAQGYGGSGSHRNVPDFEWSSLVPAPKSKCLAVWHAFPGHPLGRRIYAPDHARSALGRKVIISLFCFGSKADICNACRCQHLAKSGQFRAIPTFPAGGLNRQEISLPHH